MLKKDEIVTIADLYSLLKSPKSPSQLKPEARECVAFASFCRANSLTGDLSAVWFSVPNEFSGNKRPVFGTLQSAMGRINGAPDYIFMWGNGCGFIEMKSATGKMQPNQKIFKAWCEQNNVAYEICRSSEEAVNVLRKWKCLNDN